jgi:hypothetical protein
LAEPDGPWARLPGRALTARRLAREMRRFGVKPVTFDRRLIKAKGYVTFPTGGKQAQLGLDDAWSRYLDVTSDNRPGPTVTGKSPLLISSVTPPTSNQSINNAVTSPVTGVTAERGGCDD